MGFFDGIVDFITDDVVPAAAAYFTGGASLAVLPPGDDGFISDITGELMGEPNDGFTGSFGGSGSGFNWNSLGGTVKDIASAGSSVLGSPAFQTGFSAYAADRAYDAQKEVNAANLAHARELMAFNKQEAADARAFNSQEAFNAWGRNEASAANQRDWTTWMSNTQYQRAVGDMQAAGLNPMLAYMKGGNAFGGGAAGGGPAATSPAASSGALSRAESPHAAALHAFSSAAGVRKTLGELENLSATNDRIRAESEALRASAGVSRAQVSKIFEGDIPSLSSGARLHSAQETESRQRTGLLVEETVRVMAEVDRIAVQNKLTAAETQKVLQETLNAVLTGDRIKAETSNIQVNTKLHNLQVPRAGNMAEAEKTWFMQNIAPFLRAFGLGTGISIPIRPFR